MILRRGLINSVLASAIVATVTSPASAWPCDESLSTVTSTSSVYSFDSIDAISTDDVWTTGESEQAEFWHWDGEEWSEVVGPSPQEGQYNLNAVSGGGTNDVWAVGNESRTPRAAALHWDGQAWSPSTVPDVGRESLLVDVQAFLDGTAYAVGAFKAEGHRGVRPLVLYFDGASWTRELLGLGRSDFSLLAVSGIARDSTWVVAGNESFVLRRNVDGWSKVSLPARFVDRDPDLVDSATAPEGDAWFVGEVGRGRHPLVLRLDGQEWTRFEAPDRRYDEYLFAVDTASEEDVWIAGLRIYGDHAYPYAAHLTESGFAYTKAENPGWLAFWDVSVDETGGVWTAGEHPNGGLVEQAC